MRTIDDYSDCDVFKPGEIWQTPRGLLLKVESVKVGGIAVLRDGAGRKRMRSWDGVLSWVRIAAASEARELPSVR